jgi:hypothetical protein
MPLRTVFLAATARRRGPMLCNCCLSGSAYQCVGRRNAENVHRHGWSFAEYFMNDLGFGELSKIGLTGDNGIAWNDRVVGNGNVLNRAFNAWRH